MSAQIGAFLRPYDGVNYDLIGRGDSLGVGPGVSDMYHNGFYQEEHTQDQNDECWRQLLRQMLERCVRFRLPDAGRYKGTEVNWIPGHLIGGKCYGPQRNKVAVVGKLPDADDCLYHRHFSGDSGKLLRKTIAKYELNLDAMYGTTMTKFPMPYPNMKTIPAAWKKECAYFLQQELITVDPEYVLILGADALKALLGKKATIKASRGRPLEIPWLPNAKAIVTNNPADILRNPEKTGEFDEGIRLFAKLVHGKDLSDEEEHHYTYVRDMDQLQAMITEIAPYKVYALDVETTGLEYKKGEILTIQISHKPGHAYVVVLRSLVSKFEFAPAPAKAINELRRLLCRKDVVIVG
ncbi:MAG TPA: hypothetical protein ENH11_04205, partial [Candidatus Acetothermia bacterium]|nr:hypothetical protein [Candidatus Acetothermia bacterium]